MNLDQCSKNLVLDQDIKMKRLIYVVAGGGVGDGQDGQRGWKPH